MKEKHSVIEGLAPNPMKKSPIPSILTYFDKATRIIAPVPIPHASFRASLVPKLSAINGIIKKPTSEPTNIISCRIETIVLWSSHIKKVSNSNIIDGAC